MTDNDLWDQIRPVLERELGARLIPAGTDRMRFKWEGVKSSNRTVQVLKMKDQGHRTDTMRRGFFDVTKSGTGPDDLIVCAYVDEDRVEWSAAWSRQVADSEFGSWSPGGFDGSFWSVPSGAADVDEYASGQVDAPAV